MPVSAPELGASLSRFLIKSLIRCLCLCSPDPYATLEVEQEKFTSQVQKKTLKPKWKEKFRFQLGSYPRSRSEEDRKKNRTLWKKVRKKVRL